MGPGTIVALGGGGFSVDTEDTLLDDHVISRCRRPDRPRVCFVPTASGDALLYVEKFEAAFADRAETSVLALFAREIDDLRAHVLAQDVVYVGGGSTANLLALWRLHGLDGVLLEAHREGIVLAGISAGMNCWFEASVTDSFSRERLDPLLGGLGLVSGSACPHYDGEELRRPTYLRLVGEGILPAGYAAEEDCALVFGGGALVEAVSSRAGARAFRVHREGDAAVETPLPVRLLTGPPDPVG